MLVVYPLPDKGYRYPIRRGSGLFIYLLGVWRCLLRDRQEVIPRFFRITTKKSNQEWRRHRTKQMDKILKHLMLLLVTTLSLTFTSCRGDDNKDEPNNPNVSGKIETFSLRANKPGDKYPTGETMIYLSSWDYVSISLNDINGPMLEVSGGEYTHPHIKYFGNVNSIKDITYQNIGSITETTTNAVDNGGYVIEYTYDGNVYYIRLRITLNESNAGELVGCNVQWQQL